MSHTEGERRISSGRSTSYEPGKPTYTLDDLAGDAVAVLDGRCLRGRRLVRTACARGDVRQRLGSADPLFPLPHGIALAEPVPGATLVTVDGGGHELHEEDWDQILEAIDRHTHGDG